MSLIEESVKTSCANYWTVVMNWSCHSCPYDDVERVSLVSVVHMGTAPKWTVLVDPMVGDPEHV